jgi:hypothetical protein
MDDIDQLQIEGRLIVLCVQVGGVSFQQSRLIGVVKIILYLFIGLRHTQGKEGPLDGFYMHETV